jgi:hypothetical protein
MPKGGKMIGQLWHTGRASQPADVVRLPLTGSIVVLHGQLNLLVL